MKRSQRQCAFPTLRLVSLLVCYALIVTTTFLPLSPSVMAGAPGSNSAVRSSFSAAQPAGLFAAPGRLWASLVTLFQSGGGLPSVPGPNLPDLDAARQTQANEPEAPPATASEQVCEECAAPCPDCVINHKPVARTGGPYFGAASQPIQFNGLGSFDPDPDDEISDFIWTFGDSTPAVVVHGGTPVHTYAGSGIYTVTLKVKDLQNVSSDLATTTATVNAGPTPTPTPNASPTPTPQQANDATFVSQSVQSTMTAGSRYSVAVTMRNTGSTTWSAAHLYRLGSQSPQDNSVWGRARVFLPTTVAPGAEVTFNFSVLAPQSGGFDTDGPPPVPFQWRMVQDGIGYFGALTQSQSITITSNYQPPNGDAPGFGPFSDLFMSRIAVQHRVGQPGEDLLSGNYNWGIGLLNLPGRAGLNLNLGLSYNSLAAWTKVIPPYMPLMPPRFQQHTSWTFDADRGFPSVGFRLGFPSIQGPFSNVQTGTSSYLMLAPSGARIELRRIDSSNLYEAADSSYMQLIEGGNGGLMLRTTDGSQFSYLSLNGEFRCTEIKDRNGNYITIKYDLINGSPNPGRVTSVIDTVGRTINFTYDSNYRIQTIEQLRNGQQPQVWASFGYGDIEVQPNFSDTGEGDAVSESYESRDGKDGVAVFGLPQKSIVSVLAQVGLSDGSHYIFDYTGWGQVYKVTHYAVDSTSSNPHPLSYVSYNLPTDNSDPQTDGPLFTERQDWVENFNNNSPATTEFEINQDGQWGRVTAADGTTYKEFFTTEYTDWKRGLVTRTETYSADSATPKKTTVTDWAQDSLNVAYPLNPRATATTISDSDGNRRRTTTDYDSYGLPSDVFELGPSGSNGWTLLRRTHTDYELSAAYVNQRLIGLSKQEFLFGPEDNGQRLYSKVSYECDAGGEFLVDQNNPVQHDANFGTGFATRGNVTRALRWDVNYEADISHATASTSGYNTTGSIIFSRDALGHQTTISYADSFSTNGTNSTSAPGLTLAYPTTVTIHDPDEISSITKYHYDLGLVTRTQDPKGAAVTTEYDAAGRVTKTTNTISGAYTRFVYPTTQLVVNKFTTIKDLTTETYTATVLDGAGRVRAVAGDFPNSNGHYSGQFTLYDFMGRAIQQTNPTEMNNVWEASGDDSAGWYSSTQTYDWKGRPLITTNPSVTSNPNDTTTKEASYGGCGCAGGAVVRLTDEGTIVNGVAKKRQQKIYSDSLGRTVKTEVLDWEGTGPSGVGRSVYSTTINSYNVRDQLTLVREFDTVHGTPPVDPNDLSCPSGTCQQTTTTYDGYGRLKSNRVPEQDANTATTYDYNPDDTIQTITDARGATQSFTYNNRHLVTGVNYSAPSGIAPTPSATFVYDSAGNRTFRSDGSGSVASQFNDLSQLFFESHTFTGLPGNYDISYEYKLDGQVKNLSYAGLTIDYGYDTVGRVTTVTGSPFAGVTDYISDIKYRAFGSPRKITYGIPHFAVFTYNSRMQLQRYNLKQPYQGQDYDNKVVDHDYYADGAIRFAHDTLDERFDRAYSYDATGALKDAYTGSEARSYRDTGYPLNGGTGAYRQSYQHDVWGNMTSRYNRYWSQQDSLLATYLNNRNSQYQYDSAGNIRFDPDFEYRYDAAGQNATMRPLQTNQTITQLSDSDGQMIRKTAAEDFHYLRSTVLGGKVVAEYRFTQLQKRYVYLGDKIIATLVPNVVNPRYENPVTGSRLDMEPDTQGVDVGLSDPFTNPDPPPPPPDIAVPSGFSSGTCLLNGFTFDCTQAARMVKGNSALHCAGCEEPVFGDKPSYFDDANQLYFNAGNHDPYAQVEDPLDGYVVWVRGFQRGRKELGLNSSYLARPHAVNTPALDPAVLKALNDCIEKLWAGGVKLASFSPSSKRKGGSATFSYDIFNGRKGIATVENDSTSFSAATLDLFGQMVMHNSADYVPQQIEPKNAQGITIYDKGTPGFVAELSSELEGGVVLRFSPYRNFTANDRQKYSSGFDLLEKRMGKVAMTQAYELANSIGAITDWNPATSKDLRREPGHVLAQCMTTELQQANK